MKEKIYGYPRLVYYCTIAILLMALPVTAVPGYNSIDSLNREAKRYLDINFPRALQLATAARQGATTNNYTQGIIESSCISSYVLVNTNHCQEAIGLLQALQPAAQQSGDAALMMKLYSATGIYWFYHGNYDSAKTYHTKALQVCPTGRRSPVYAQECLLLGKVYIKTGDPGKALAYYTEANAIFDKHPDEAGKAWAQDLLGEVYYAQRLYDQAIACQQYSYDLFSKLEQVRGAGCALLHQGNAYYMLVKDDSAKACYSKALHHFTTLGDSNGMAICYSNLSRVVLESGDHLAAIDYAKKALNTIQPGNYITVEAGTCQQLGDIYGELKQYDKAVSYIQQALQAARSSDNKIIAADCHKSLSELYEVMGQPALALKNLLAAYRLKDSIQPFIFSRQLADMEAKYEAEKRQAEIKLLKQQQQIQDSKLQKQRYLLLMSLIVLVVIVIALYYYIARRKLLEEVHRQHTIRHTEEKERQRIAKDIHDELGSGLSKIRFLSELAGAPAADGTQLHTSLQSIAETSRGLVENMRDLVWAMNPENTTLDNLVARIREYTHDYLEEFPVEITFDIPEDIPHQRITKELSRNVYMIVKEALQNIVKHADADKVSLHIAIYPQLRIALSDNGKGYDRNMSKPGNGLTNMAARAAAIGGRMDTAAAPGQGTQVVLEVPWQV